jgi:NitT/TauT family transport system permease protein
VRKYWLVPFIAPAAVLLAWEAAVRTSLLDRLFFPPPSALWATFLDMARQGELARRVGVTLMRAGDGFLIGALPGVACGALMGASSWIRRALEPFLAALYATPKLTLLPMLMLLAGTGELPRQILIAATVFLVVVMNTVDGVRGVQPHFVEMAANYGASRRMLFRRVYLPSSAPHIFTGLRLGMGRALVLAITVEMIGGGNGLGSLVWTAWLTFSPERLYIAVILSAILGAAVHRSLKLVESRLIPWRAR